MDPDHLYRRDQPDNPERPVLGGDQPAGQADPEPTPPDDRHGLVHCRDYHAGSLGGTA